MKKMLLALVVFMLMATPAIAGNQPEFDAVGCDASNFFNDFIKIAVCENGTIVNAQGVEIRINEFSAFAGESFTQTAGQEWPDPCFNGLRGCIYTSALTDPWNEGIYVWEIVLQKKPESDINLNIRDCVVKHNTFNVWTECEQTGRYRAPWGQLFFIPSANPSVTAEVFPGPYATPGFTVPFILDARQMPGLDLVAMEDAIYTSKCLWDESLIMALPATGSTNVLGDATYNLKQGDRIRITISIPGNNTVDLFYGRDNVVLKYIGIVGTEYVAPGPACATCGDCLSIAG